MEKGLESKSRWKGQKGHFSNYEGSSRIFSSLSRRNFKILEKGNMTNMRWTILIFQENNIKIFGKWQITIIPLEEWIITKMPLQSESEHLQWPSEKYLSKLKSQPLDLPQIRRRSRQRIDHHIPRLVVKAKVGKALIRVDFSTNYLERSIFESRRIWSFQCRFKLLLWSLK